MHSLKPSKPCKVCTRIRLFLLATVPIFFVILTRPEIGEGASETITFFTRLDVLTDVIAIIIAMTLLWKFFKEKTNH